MHKKHLLLALAAAAAISANATEFSLDGLRYSVTDYTHATVLGLADASLQVIFIPYTISYELDGTEYLFYVTKVADNAFADTGITNVTFTPPPYSGAASQGTLLIGNEAFNTTTLRAVNTFRPHIPDVEGDPFSEVTYTEGNLGFGVNLTQDEIDAYKAIEPWSKFFRTEVTGIDEARTDSSTGQIEIFTPGGMRVYSGSAATAALPHGIYIVRDGSKISKTAF